MASNNGPKQLVIVGDGETGKTCLVTLFGQNKFNEEHVPTVSTHHTAYVDIKKIRTHLHKVELNILDTGDIGREKLSELFICNADVVLMCFAIDRPETLASIESKWYPEMRVLCEKARVVLVGTKIDLRDDEDTRTRLSQSKQKPLKPKDGKNMAKKICASSYIECSSKSNKGVKEVFTAVYRAAWPQLM